MLKTKQCPSVEMLQANPIHPETLDWIRGPPIDFMKVLSDMVTLQECCEGLLNHKVCFPLQDTVLVLIQYTCTEQKTSHT